MVEHLHLDGAEEGLAHGRQRPGPDEHARVAARLQVPPLELEDEVLVLPLRAQRAGGDAVAVDQAVAHREGLGRAVHVHPAREVAAVEQRREAVRVRRADMSGADDEEEDEGEWSAHGGSEPAGRDSRKKASGLARRLAVPARIELGKSGGPRHLHLTFFP
ncbi:MAG TPA: hypothetical protein PKE47_15245 [Verrucomicrobiota bacterium]|nr:hypothetical protein [Verrucomicrobiota bacterium]